MVSLLSWNQFLGQVSTLINNKYEYLSACSIINASHKWSKYCLMVYADSFPAPELTKVSSSFLGLVSEPTADEITLSKLSSCSSFFILLRSIISRKKTSSKSRFKYSAFSSLVDSNAQYGKPPNVIYSFQASSNDLSGYVVLYSIKLNGRKYISSPRPLNSVIISLDKNLEFDPVT